MAGFYSARGWIIPPLPWPTFAPPLSEVMYRINRQHKGYSVDKVIAYSFKDPVISHETVEARGAVFRSRGHWYHLQYLCRTGPRHLDAHKLTYEIGAEIPRKQWAAHYLYD